MINLTNEQKAVVNAPIGNMLVSAAAGSGKTSVLVERILTKLIQGAFNIDDILVVTFTRDAATNMQMKIDRAIRQRITELCNEDRTKNADEISRLKLQLDKLPNAYIQTFNSFCARVIKEKGYILEDSEGKSVLDPSRIILDENELTIVRNKACTNAIESKYKDDILDESFLTLTKMFGDGRDDVNLSEVVLGIFLKLRSLPDYLGLLTNIQSQINEDDSTGRLSLYDIVFEDISVVVDAGLANSDKLRSAISSATFLSTPASDKKKKQALLDIVDAYDLYFLRCKKAMDEYASLTEIDESSKLKRTVDALHSLPVAKDKEGISGNLKYEALTKSKDISDGVNTVNELFAPIATMAILFKQYANIEKNPNGYNGSVQYMAFPMDIRDCLDSEYDVLIEEQKRRHACVSSLIELIRRTDKEYAVLKDKIGGMDYSDQEHIAYKILLLEEAYSYYRQKFVEIYIDEYQDNSSLQDAIVDEFSSNNVFRVGDVKQSIYKFRYANPYMFISRMNEYANGTNGSLSTLSCNFRSTREILDFVNVICEQVMTEKATEIEYDEKQRLNHPTNEKSGFVPNVVAIEAPQKGESDVTNIELMCEGVRTQVEKFVSMGYELRDICILSRKKKSLASISDYLNQSGFDSTVTESKSIFEDVDIRGIANLIIVLNNELRDEYMLGVMLSPYKFSNFSLEEVARIRLFSGRTNNLIENIRLYEAMGQDSKLRQRVQHFLEVFDDLRNNLIMTDIGRLVEKIYIKTNIRASAVGKDASLLSKKLNVFKEWLCSNFSRYGSDIASVSNCLEQTKIKLKYEAAITIEDTKSNKIRCMTCHSSKGLEFPCVVFAEPSTKEKAELTETILFDEKMGFAIKNYYDEDVRITNSVESIYLKQKETLANYSELIRLLYVTLTRAKEQLSIVTVIRQAQAKKVISQAFLAKQLTYDKFFWLSLGALNINNILLPALARTSMASPVAKIAQVDGYVEYPIDFNAFTLECLDIKQILDGDESEESEESEENEEYGGEESGFSPSNAGIDSDNGAYADDISLKNSDVENETTNESMALGVNSDGKYFFDAYPYESATRAPFKISVSQISKNKQTPLVPLNLEVSSYDDYKDEAVLMTSAGKGTFIHKLFRFVDLNELDSLEQYTSQVRRMIVNGTIFSSQEGFALEQYQALKAFGQSSLGCRLISSDLNGKAFFEKPIVFSIPLESSTNDVMDFSLVQGIIDLMFIEDDGKAVIVDYKTDNLDHLPDIESRVKEAMNRHSTQINCYAEAIAASGIVVKEKYLWLVRYNETVKV